MENPEQKNIQIQFCPRCNAELAYQKGYDPRLHTWVCRGCGEMLINPEVDNYEDDVVWICDNCGAIMNDQEGFERVCSASMDGCENAENADGEWTCRICGYRNKIDPGEIFASDEAYMARMADPMNGLSDDDLRRLMEYSELDYVRDHQNVMLVNRLGDDEILVKKTLTTYDAEMYRFLKDNPVEHMPRIHEVFEARNHLIVIEDFIDGETVHEMIEEDELPETIEFHKALDIALKVCRIAAKLHCLERPIIHRDIKPSNIICRPDGEVILLDMDAAKWYNSDENEDTRLMGTQYYAAPEQYGFGYTGSSAKTDVYAIGMLLNKMLTGKFPKEKKAEGEIWKVIEKCISYDAGERYEDGELIKTLEKFAAI